MGALLKKIQERSLAVQPTKVEVPELGDETGPLVVFMHPLTLAQRSKLMPLIEANDLSFIPKSVVMSAKDEDGNPVFDLADEKAMVRSKDIGWINRLASSIKADLEDMAEAVGEN